MTADRCEGLRARLSGWTVKVLPHVALAALVTAATVSCATSSSVQDGASGSSATGTSAPGPKAALAATATSDSSAVAAPASASAARAAEAETFRFADLVNDLSEPDTYFFSDNIISNETSFLQPAEALAARSDPSSVYIGVGPEQNFTYIALTKPSVAFVVDIRRANMLLQLLYRAAFEEANDRAQFLALLLGRPLPEAGALDAKAGISDVVSAATKSAGTKASFEDAQAKLMKRIDGYGVKLGDEDKKGIAKMHAVFHKEGIDVRFELHEKNGRLYPTLRELLDTTSPSGKTGSFLATDESFRFLQTMQRAGRIVPVVGDFAGNHALPQLASYLKSDKLSVSTFYVSNVEQYLLEPKVWKNWVRNVKALPKTDDAVFIRAYLDQGRKHPKQMKGHRTATVLSKMSDFESSFGEKDTTTFFTLCTDKNL
ncbi:MAG: hypothetical protein HOW73_02610 [Polyangiaceae bacterium]|nr:hypothetical protein [Polyangiaceae bacterium]